MTTLIMVMEHQGSGTVGTFYFKKFKNMIEEFPDAVARPVSQGSSRSVYSIVTIDSEEYQKLCKQNKIFEEVHK